MRAYRQVVSNKGSAGVDGISVKELYDHLTQNREQIESDIRKGTYLPQPIKGVEIPKSNGKTRLLGVPTVTDRMLQQAVAQVLAAGGVVARVKRPLPNPPPQGEGARSPRPLGEG